MQPKLVLENIPFVLHFESCQNSMNSVNIFFQKFTGTFATKELWALENHVHVNMLLCEYVTCEYVTCEYVTNIFTSTWFSSAKSSFITKFQDSQSSYSFGVIQNVGETELSEEKIYCCIGEIFHILFSYILFR